ncbi:MAG: hypothetical protein RPS47_02690 [Colwellia sp.]|jgi:hypothetical protein
MTDEGLYPIEDWSLTGRSAYVEKNRAIIELVICRAIDILGDKKVFDVFRSEEQAVEEVIKRFLVANLNPSQLPKRDISLFGQLQFWIKHKTGGRASSKSFSKACTDQVERELVSNHIGPEEISIENRLESLSNSFDTFRKLVAPDIAGYWMGANKKLLDEFSIPADVVVEHVGSEAKKTKYKADATFRFCYHFLALSEKLAGENHRASFEAKYLKMGPNKPQYVSGIKETHIDKHNVRLFIKKVILFYEDNYNDYDHFVHCLLKPMTKKSLLDQYEFDKESINEFGNKLKLLSKTKEVI